LGKFEAILGHFKQGNRIRSEIDDRDLLIIHGDSAGVSAAGYATLTLRAYSLNQRTVGAVNQQLIGGRIRHGHYHGLANPALSAERGAGNKRHRA
jgi:hypothetical protein